MLKRLITSSILNVDSMVCLARAPGENKRRTDGLSGVTVSDRHARRGNDLVIPRNHHWWIDCDTDYAQEIEQITKGFYKKKTKDSKIY
jgi:hypothetical protein